MDDAAADNYIEYLIEAGALYVGGIGEDGQDVLYMNGPLLKELCEPLYNSFLMEVDQEIIKLVDKGYATLEWDEHEADFIARLTEEGYKAISE